MTKDISFYMVKNIQCLDWVIKLMNFLIDVLKLAKNILNKIKWRNFIIMMLDQIMTFKLKKILCNGVKVYYLLYNK